VVYSSQSSTSISMFGASMPFCLTAPPTPTLFSVFAFHHRRLPCITGICTPPQLGASSTAFFPSLHVLERSSPVVFIKSTRDFMLYNFYTVSALSFIWELFFSLHMSSHYSTSLDPMGTHAQSLCALVQFIFSRFLPIPCLCLTAVHPVTTPVQVKIGCQSLSPCCISLSLSGSSSILPSRNHNHRI